MMQIGRRSLLAAISLALVSPATVLGAPSVPVMRVSKDPYCGCCAGWIRHIRAAGFQATVSDVTDLAAVKTRLKIPDELASCHTAEIDGYVIEGHVPASAIKRLLAERPAAAGLAVPGMPAGSPGMEAGGAADEPYDVILFGPGLRRTYARLSGPKEL